MSLACNGEMAFCPGIEFFNLSFTMKGLTPGWMRFRIQHGEGATTSGVFCAFSVFMGLKATFEICRDSGIEGFIGAL